MMGKMLWQNSVTFGVEMELREYVRREKTDRLQEGLKKEEILSDGGRRVVHRSLVSQR